MTIDISRDGGVATVTINRPERKNALSLAMRLDLTAKFLEIQDDHAVRAVVLTGAGGDFAAGADISEMGTGGVRGNMEKARTLHRLLRSVAHCDKPVIAAVEGVCMGFAFSLALASDFTICAEDARFQFAFRNIGLAMDGAAGWLLERHVGLMRAKEIAYTGRMVSGTEAARLGIALEALPKGDVQARAAELAAGLATAPLSLYQIKRQFDAGAGQTLDQALDFEFSAQALMTWSEDFKEGTTAFKERRKSEFKGA